MPRCVDDGEGFAADVKGHSVGEQKVGIAAFLLVEVVGRHEIKKAVVGVLQAALVGLMNGNLGTRQPLERQCAKQMVAVAVGEQNILKLGTQLGGSVVAVGTLIAGVDDGAITVFAIDYISIAAGILNKGLIFHAITF